MRDHHNQPEFSQWRPFGNKWMGWRLHTMQKSWTTYWLFDGCLTPPEKSTKKWKKDIIQSEFVPQEFNRYRSVSVIAMPGLPGVEQTWPGTRNSPVTHDGLSTKGCWWKIHGSNVYNIYYIYNIYLYIYLYTRCPKTLQTIHFGVPPFQETSIHIYYVKIGN